MPDVEFYSSVGWVAQPTKLDSIVTRAPTHEPYPYHNRGVPTSTKFSGAPTPPPDAPEVPKDVTITKTGDTATTAAKATAANPGNAEEIAKLKATWAESQKELASDLEFRATVVADNRPDAAAFLLEIDQNIADRRKLIAITQQKIASLGG